MIPRYHEPHWGSPQWGSPYVVTLETWYAWWTIDSRLAAKYTDLQTPTLRERTCHAQHALQVWDGCTAQVIAAVRWPCVPRCQRLYCCPQALYAHSALAATASYKFVSVVSSRHAAKSRPARRRSRQAQSAEKKPADKRSCTAWPVTASTTAAGWYGPQIGQDVS